MDFEEDAQRPARILAVDDDPLVREIMISRLTSPERDVVTAADGEDAYNLLLDGGFNLVVTDLDMPVLDGFGLIERIRNNSKTATVPVIVVTGVEDGDACSQALGAGATSFVIKPVNWSLLMHQINFVLANAERENALREARVSAEYSAIFRGNLMRAISHELRTPLNAVVGFAQIMQNELFGPLGNPVYQGHVKEIVEAADRLNAMIGDTLLASRLLTEDFEPVFADYEINELLRSVTVGLEDEAAARKVHVEIDARDICIRCDAALVQSALKHLITNAIQFAPAESGVRVSAKTVRTHVAISIEDHGCGIKDGVLPELFDHFSQGDTGLTRNSSGLGLGLPIAKAVARVHKGSLSIENRAEGGLRATLKLPRCVAESGDLQDAA